MSDEGPAGAGGAGHRRAELVFAVAALGAALFLASQLGHQVRWIASRPFFDQPGFVSAVAVAGMVLFGAFELAFAWRRRHAAGGPGVAPELRHWLVALEYPLWFFVYVSIVPVVGYLAATIAFCLALTLRLGYRSARTLGAALLVAVATVVVFKAFLAVKIPGGAAYEWLPRGLANVMSLYF